MNDHNENSEGNGPPPIQFDVSFSVTKKNFLERFRGGGKTVHILENIKGSFYEGEAIALMGSSGGGKTTLIDILAARKNYGNIEGYVKYHGIPKKKLTNHEAGYVPQSDIALAHLTVRETIEFQIRLRLGLIGRKCTELADKLMEDLMISHCADNKVGNDMVRGISGGELRRLSIAQELINAPKLLFLDEPTSGLDSRASYEVVNILKNLAKTRNQVIILTIHQPSSQCFHLFDKLLLLSKQYSPNLGKKVGRLAYFGPISGVKDYFTNHLGLPCPPEKNIADHILDAYDQTKSQKAMNNIVVDVDGKPNDNEESEGLNLGEKYLEWVALNGGETEETPNEDVPIIHEEEEDNPRYPTGYLNQYFTLVHRSALNTVRLPNFIPARVFKPHFIGAVISSVYFRMDYDPLNIQNRVSAVFFILLTSFMLSNALLSVFIESRPLAVREKASRLYGNMIQLTSTLTVIYPAEIFNAVIFVTYINWITNLFPTAVTFFRFMLIFLLCVILMNMYAMMIGSTAATEEAAAVIAPVIFMLGMILCGFFVLTEGLPPWWKWAKWVSPFYYALSAALYTQFNGVTWNCSRTEYDYSVGRKNCTFQSGDQLLQLYGISLNEGTFWAYTLSLIGYILICFILLYLSLRFIRWDRR